MRTAAERPDGDRRREGVVNEMRRVDRDDPRRRRKPDSPVGRLDCRGLWTQLDRRAQDTIEIVEHLELHAMSGVVNRTLDLLASDVRDAPDSVQPEVAVS